MSDFSSFTGKFRAGKLSVQESSGSQGKISKRPRESLVCEQCRKSKLRCDRGRPCGSCIKKGQDDACTYQRSVGSGTDHNQFSKTAEDRLSHLEFLVKELMQNHDSARPNQGMSSVSAVTSSEVPVSTANPVFHNSNETPESKGYVGSTHWSAILDDIHEIKTALLDTQEVRNHTPSHRNTPEAELIFGSSKNFSLEQITSQYLPSKVEVDTLVSIYCQGETFIIPFIHTHHFQRQYEKFWTEKATVNPLWLSMLFSICCLAVLTKGADGSQQSPIPYSSDFHIAAGQCLVLGNYHRPQKFSVEALGLYAQCKNLRTLDPSREAGAIFSLVVRMAYEMGYHRDPDSFGRFTVFEGEMRRRFWAACMQMDLMLSFQLGLPSNINLESYDTKSPRNLLDSDFDEDTKILRSPRPETDQTNLLWFIVKDRQMIQFSKVCKHALSFQEKSEGEILQLDREIRQMYATVPDNLRSRPMSESLSDGPFIILTRLYNYFLHLKCICILHRRYMVQGNTFSTKSCAEAGKRLVSQFLDVYKEFSPGGYLASKRWMLSSFTWNDFLLGNMVLCLVVHTFRKQGVSHFPADFTTENELTSLLEQSYKICVEESQASQDARRVSRAIRMILNGAKSSHPTLGPDPQLAHQMQSNVPSYQQSLPGNGNDIGLASLSLQMECDELYGGDLIFGGLDPFSIVGSDFSNIDLGGAFDPHILGQDL